MFGLRAGDFSYPRGTLYLFYETSFFSFLNNFHKVVVTGNGEQFPKPVISISYLEPLFAANELYFILGTFVPSE